MEQKPASEFPDKGSKDLESHIRAERIRYLFQNGHTMYIGGSMLSLLVAAAHWNYHPPYIVLGWLFAILAVYGARVHTLICFSKESPGPDELSPWLMRQYAGSLAAGLGWGIGFYLLFTENSPMLQLFIVVCLIGLLASAALAFSSEVYVSHVFTIPVSALTILRIMLGEAENSLVLAGAISIGVVVTFFVTRNMNRFVVDALKLRYENINLVEELDQANQRYKILSDANFEGILIHHEGIVLEANETLIKTFGYEKLENIQGKRLMDLVAKESKELVWEKVRLEDTNPYEIMVYDANMEKVPVEVQGKPMPYKGKIVRVVAVRSLTQQKQDEKRIQESERKLRSLFDNTSDLISIHDLDGRITSANKSFLRLTGYTWEEMEGMKISQVIAPEYHQQADAMQKVKMEGATETRYDLEFISRSGERIPLELNTRLIMEDGKPVGVQGFGRDITARVRAERQMKAANTFLQNLIDTIPNPVFYKNSEMVYTGCNRAFEEFLGKKREEIIGKTVYELSPKNFADKYHEMDMDLFNKGGVQIYESRVARPEGERHVLFYKACFDNPDGSRGGIVGVILDITEQKQASEKLKAALARAEEATEVKDKFVSLVAHDLRNPISAINGFIELLMADTKGQISQKSLSIFQRIQAMLSNMMGLIENIMSITRLQAGIVKPHKRYINLRKAVEANIIGLSLQAEQKNILIRNLAPEEMKIFADPDLLPEVTFNLISNSLKFCNKGGEIIISAMESSEGYVITVSDNGVGIPRNLIKDIFRHDVKTTTNGTAGERGSGFGLPLCKDIVVAHGGEISVKSEPGAGSEFSIRLPASKPKILVVDDQDVDREILKAALNWPEAEFVEASNGAQGLESFRTHWPNLVIVDISMPKMSGFDMLQVLKSDPAARQTPVIMVTAGLDIQDKEKAFELGASDFIMKPYQASELIPRVKRFFE